MGGRPAVIPPFYCMRANRIILLLTALTLAGNAMAQEREAAVGDGTVKGSLFPKTTPSRWCVGLYAGRDNNHHVIDMSYASGMKYSDRTGMAAGLSGEYHLTGWFSLRAELALVQKNFRLDRDNIYFSFAYTEATNNYLSLPVEAVLSMGRTFRVCCFLGGYGGYWLSGHREGQSLSVSYLVSGDEADTYFDEDYSFNEERDNRIDAGLTYGVGLRCTILRKIDLSAELHWYYGLTDIQKQYMTNLNPRYNTTRVIRMGVAYWL